MSTGLLATIVVFVLVGIFGLIVLLDRKSDKKAEDSSKVAAGAGMSPKEAWDAHVEKLRARDPSSD